MYSICLWGEILFLTQFELILINVNFILKTKKKEIFEIKNYKIDIFYQIIGIFKTFLLKIYKFNIKEIWKFNWQYVLNNFRIFEIIIGNRIFEIKNWYILGHDQMAYSILWAQLALLMLISYPLLQEILKYDQFSFLYYVANFQPYNPTN